MPRELAEDTQYVYWRAWRWPWASATDIARATGLKASAVSTTLKRGEKRGWFLSARLGRTASVVDRYVVSNAGVEELDKRFGWGIFWWHTADGVRSLARRLEVLEMAYTYLPFLWQSNLVSDRKAFVFREPRDISQRTGEPGTRVSLVETDWSVAGLTGFSWLKDGPFEAIATYYNGNPDDALLHLPCLWRGNFQKREDIAWVRREMDRALVKDERWENLPTNQQVFGDYPPGMIIFCPDRVSAAMVQRNWLESSTRREHRATPAILDAQGQVVRAMSPPTSRWKDYVPSPHGGPLGDIQKAVSNLKSGAYASVNGKRAWRTFRAVDGSPGVTLEQTAASVGVDTTVARGLLEPMVKAKVIIVKGGGHYLDVSGRGLLAYSQRKSPSRVKRRWGVYLRKGGEYRRDQRLHNQGQAQVILKLRQHGFSAFPTMGVVIEDWYRERKIRIVPDAFVVLPPGVLVAIEFERSATSPREVEEKAQNYARLVELGHPLPVLFITETPQAAENLCRLRHPYLLAATLDTVQEGPHGRASFRDGAFIDGAFISSKGADSGCWWHWYSDRGAPSSKAPIDSWAQLYVQDDHNTVWRLPIDHPFRLV